MFFHTGSLSFYTTRKYIDDFVRSHRRNEFETHTTRGFLSVPQSVAHDYCVLIPVIENFPYTIG